jgi:hypothetical protein
MTASIDGMIIPAHPWDSVRIAPFPLTDRGTLHLDFLRTVIDCQFVEAIYPAWSDREENMMMQGFGHRFVMWGDEEARYRQPFINDRATMFFGYPYPIVGTVVLFGDQDTCISVPESLPDFILEHWSARCVS